MNRLLIAIALALASVTANAQTPTPLANYLPGFRTIDGSQLNKMVAQVNNLSGNGTAQNLTCTRCYASNGTVALPSFTFTTDPDTGLYRIGANNIGVAANGAKVLDISTSGLGTTGTETITSASALALAVGRLGATTPAFQVDASTATSITGIKIKSAGTGGGVAISAIGEASNGALSIDAQGSGTVTIAGTSTGAITLTRATSFTAAINANAKINTNATPPVLSACGTGSPTITGSDTAGIVTMGTNATGCVITFAAAYTGTPYCVVSWIATPLASQSYVTANTAITTTQTSASGNKLQYVCVGPSGG